MYRIVIDHSLCSGFGDCADLAPEVFELESEGRAFLRAGESDDPAVLIAAQLLDGLSEATLGVLVPLVIADTTRGTGHFNFAQGVVGVAVGLGASFGTTIAGFIADMFGDAVVFLFLGSVGAFGLLLVLALMPETRAALAAMPDR